MIPRIRSILTCLLLTSPLSLFSPLPLAAQTDWDAVEVQVTQVREGLHMITAAGGNLAVFLGPDGGFLVDADYGEITDRILSTIDGLARHAGGASGAAEVEIRFLVNTHWHFDHTSGNGNLAEAGATIIAHENVARLLEGDQSMPALGNREIPAYPPEARPLLTFNDRMNLAFNGDLIHLIHMPYAHSDGDIVVHFRDADVIHMGDLFFNGMYPYIDVDFGGNLEGMVGAMEEVLAHSNETTLFIPGHGPLATRSDLVAYHEMLRTALQRIKPMIEKGMNRAEVIAAKPTADLDAQWAGEGSFMQPDRWVGLAFDGMVKGSQGG